MQYVFGWPTLREAREFAFLTGKNSHFVQLCEPVVVMDMETTKYHGIERERSCETDKTTAHYRDETHINLMKLISITIEEIYVHLYLFSISIFALFI